MSELYFLIVNYNSSSLAKRLVRSLLDETANSYKIIIINNSVEDKNIYGLKSDRLTIIEAKENLGFGKACNLGLNWIYERNDRGIVWLINPDAYFEMESPVSRAIALLEKYPQISIVGTLVYNSEGKITSAGGTFTPITGGLSINTTLPKKLTAYYQTDWVSGCSLLINLANFDKCPNFDPRYFLYYEDLDFCLRYARQGHQIAVTPLLKVTHDTSSITDRNLFQKYRHITKSYLVHIEKHGSKRVFVWTNLRMLLNTLRLLILKPQQGLGKLVGFCQYWQTRYSDSQIVEIHQAGF